MTARRAVSLTLLAVGVTAALGVAGFLAYSRYDDYQDRLAAAEARAGSADKRLTGVRRQLADARAEAAREYQRGLTDARETAESIGLDFDGGYNAAFDGFGEWETDAYYIIFLAEGEGKQTYSIESRIKMEPCRGYQVIGASSPSVFTHDEPSC